MYLPDGPEFAKAEGEFGACVTIYLFKVVDYELQLDKYTGPGCN
jgi:hypothetical protein